MASTTPGFFPSWHGKLILIKFTNVSLALKSFGSRVHAVSHTEHSSSLYSRRCFHQEGGWRVTYLSSQAVGRAQGWAHTTLSLPAGGSSRPTPPRP